MLSKSFSISRPKPEDTFRYLQRVISTHRCSENETLLFDNFYVDFDFLRLNFLNTGKCPGVDQLFESSVSIFSVDFEVKKQEI